MERNLLPPVILGCLLFLLYAFTAAPGIVLEDSVFLSLSCANADIAHAPGYPLYALACFPFAHLPGVGVDLGATLFSAFCAAAACVLLARIAARLTGNNEVGLGVAALFGVSAGFWGQANVQEVYTLNVLLFFAALYLALLCREDINAKKLTLLAFVCALGISNHWPLFVLAAAGLPILLWPQRRRFFAELRNPRTAAIIFAVIVLGLSPYWYLLWRSHHPVAFMGLPFAPHDWESFWQIVSREVHFASDSQAGAGMNDKIAFLTFLAQRVLWGEAGAALGLLATAGFVMQWRRLGFSLSLSFCIMFFTGSVFLALYLDFLYDPLGEQIFSVYPLLPYAVACLWAGVAAAKFARAGAVVLAVATLVALWQNFPDNNRANDTLADDIANTYFETLPPGGFVPFPSLLKFLKFKQITENTGEQTKLFAAPNPFVWEVFYGGDRLYEPNTLTYDEEVRTLSNYARDNPLCYNTYVEWDKDWRSVEYLLFSCLQKDGGDDGDSERVQISPKAITLLERLIQGDYNRRDWRARQLAGRLVADATRSMMLLRSFGKLPEKLRPLLKSASATGDGLLARLEFLVARNDLQNSARRADSTAKAADKLLVELPRRKQARMLSALAGFYEAVYPRSLESLKIAKYYHQQAAAVIADSDSPAVRRALAFYRREKMEDEETALYALYGDALSKPAPQVIVE